MAYATLNDLVARFGQEELIQLTDRQGLGVIDGNAVQAALVDADALIESYLAQRYALPVSPVPQLLKRIAADTARFLLHGNAATEAVRAAYKDALKVLSDLSDGPAVLPGAAAAPKGVNPGAAGGQVVFTAQDRRLGAQNIGDFFG